MCRLAFGKRTIAHALPWAWCQGNCQELGPGAPGTPRSASPKGFTLVTLAARTIVHTPHLPRPSKSLSYSLFLDTDSHTFKEKTGIFNLDCLYLGRTLETLNYTVKRDKHSSTSHVSAPTLLFLFPTDIKSETFHSRPTLASLAEIKCYFSKRLSIQRKMPIKLQNALGLTDS